MNIKVLVGLMGFLSAIALCLVLNMASGVFIPLVIAWFLLQIFRPVTKLGGRLKLPPMLNISLVFALLLCIGLLGVKFVALQVTEFSHIYSQYSSKLSETMIDLMKVLNIPSETVIDFNLGYWLRSNVRNISELAIALSSKIVMTLVFLAFMILEAQYIDDKIKKAFMGVNAVRVKNILDTVSKQISSYLGALTLISVATGLCAWLILLAIGVKLATSWAVITIVLNFIPTVGSIIATIPPVVMAFIQFSPSYFRPLLVLALLTSIQITIGNVITPKVVGDRLGLSPIVILLSLLLCSMIWGIPGAVLSTPIASIIKIICENTRALYPIAVIMGSGEATRKMQSVVSHNRREKHVDCEDDDIKSKDDD